MSIMATTIQDLESWVAVMMKKKSISNYKLDLSGTSEKGDGYLGEIHFLKVDATKQDGTKAEYHIVVKSAKKNDEFRKKTPIQEAYQREIFMYTKVFPVFEEFQREYSIEEPFHKFAKCYSICSENKKEALILKNLKAAGYVIHDRTKPHNLNHALYVLRSYGQFHAISMAMKIKKPGVYNSLTKNLTDILRKFITQTDMVNSFLADFNKGVDTLRASGKEEIARKFDGLDEEIRSILMNPKHPKETHCVILHGDCWNNNMMFKYEGSVHSQPTDIRFIDFQLSSHGHPLSDLSYYLYSSCNKEVLSEFPTLLEAYYDSLGENLANVGIDVKDVISYDELMKDWKNHGKFGIVFSSWALRASLREHHEIIDLAAAIETGTLHQNFDSGFKNMEAFIQRHVDILEHFAEMFL